MPDPRVVLESDRDTGIARVTINNPSRRNAYDPEMRRQMAEYFDQLAEDDEIKVVVLRGEGGVFSTGADMGNAYAWYGPQDENGQTATARVGDRASVGGSRWTGRPSSSTTTTWAIRR